MLDTDLLERIAAELLSKREVEAAGTVQPVRRTSSHQLRTVSFQMDGRDFQAIEQNLDKPSRWGQLAKSGHKVVQFKDVETNRFVAVAVDGKVTLYGNRGGGKNTSDRRAAKRPR